jgi:subtilisin family serine protease
LGAKNGEDEMKKGLTCAIITALAFVAVAAPASAGTPNDPLYPRQWHLKRIGAPAAWTTAKGVGVTIAIVDTGVNVNHEDLRDRISPVRFDAIDGGTNVSDKNGHGTASAGVAAATLGNARGVVGVAPKARIMPIRVFDPNDPEGTAKDADTAEGVMFAADHGADVINLSLGGGLDPRRFGLPASPVGALPVPGQSEIATTYATALGSLVVASASNDSQPFCQFPAMNPAVLCVGASDQLDGIAWFSNYGVRLDVVAPGTSIWTTGAPYGAGSTLADRAYQAPSGTSEAAPIVAGIGALLMSMGANNILAATIIRLSAKDLGTPGYDLTYGFGRVDAAAAVAMCKQLC